MQTFQGIPRTVVFDKKTGNSILQWPVEEVESLRSESHNFDKLKLEQGSVLPLNIGSASQVYLFVLSLDAKLGLVYLILLVCIYLVI